MKGMLEGAKNSITSTLGAKGRARQARDTQSPSSGGKLSDQLSRALAQQTEVLARVEEAREQLTKLGWQRGLDYGPDGAYRGLAGSCYERQEGKYTYQVCPMVNATQKDYSRASLGDFAGFEDDFRIMLFQGGGKCYPGPRDRTLRLKLECQATTELLEVVEPKKCDYEGRLGTPAACTEQQEARLKQAIAELKSQFEEGVAKDEL